MEKETAFACVPDELSCIVGNLFATLDPPCDFERSPDLCICGTTTGGHYGRLVIKDGFCLFYGDQKDLEAAEAAFARKEGVCMADKEYLLGNKARDLLKYTNQATKVTSDEADRRDVREFLKRILELDDIRDVKMVVSEVIGELDRKDRKGFSKNAYRCYGEDMRMIAKGIVRDIHAANGKMFATEYKERLRLIGQVMDGCALLIEYIQLCLDLEIIDLKKSEVWTKKVLDVKYMSGSWKKNDGARARKLEAEEQTKTDQHQIELVMTAIEKVKTRK